MVDLTLFMLDDVNHRHQHVWEREQRKALGCTPVGGADYKPRIEEASQF